MPSQTNSRLQTEELDPTTARLVSELAAQMLPTLTKALNSAVPANDFTGALERTNRMSQDLRSQIEKSIRSSIEDSRAGRSVMMQSIGTLLDEIVALKRSIEKIPSGVESAIIKAAPVKEDNNNIDNNIMQKTSQEYERISELLSELITGLRTFTETYAKDSMKRELERERDRERERESESRRTPNEFAGFDSHSINENNSRLDKLLNEALPSLEGLLKVQGKTQSKELADFSKEIMTSQEQNNAALIHEVRSAVSEELAEFKNDMINSIEALQTEHLNKFIKILRFVVILSGSSLLFALLTILILLLR
ncbi:MAG: hypothetical protein IJP48_07895 [Synergistaceae bacterium]|nr:hypothetical protein [Synergistaceae bacterium]